MPRFRAAVVLVFLALIGWPAGAVGPQPPRTPVLVELFTSEGCSSCPAADLLLSELHTAQQIDGAQVIALKLHVDYWDHLGWKDPFASRAFSKRQEEYSAIFGGDKVYTPQMVVDGTAELVGSDANRATEAIRAAAARPHLPLRVSASVRGPSTPLTADRARGRTSIRTGDSLRIAVEAPAASGELEKTDITIAIIEDGLTSAVARGENRGRTLSHSAVARRLQTIGTLQRDPFVGEGEWQLNPAWQRSRLRVVAFLQGQKTRRVYGAASAPIQ
jgi:hypothetical protein